MRTAFAMEDAVHSNPRFEMQDGIPMMVHTDPVKPLTPDLVRRLAEDE